MFAENCFLFCQKLNVFIIGIFVNFDELLFTNGTGETIAVMAEDAKGQRRKLFENKKPFTTIQS